jgi:hypothetical protein
MKSNFKGGVCLRSVFVGNFGVQNGVQTYRVNGSFDDLQTILDEIMQEDGTFEEFPEIERLRFGLCTMLLKLKVREGADQLEHGR